MKQLSAYGLSFFVQNGILQKIQSFPDEGYLYIQIYRNKKVIHLLISCQPILPGCFYFLDTPLFPKKPKINHLSMLAKKHLIGKKIETVLEHPKSQGLLFSSGYTLLWDKTPRICMGAFNGVNGNLQCQWTLGSLKTHPRPFFSSSQSFSCIYTQSLDLSFEDSFYEAFKPNLNHVLKKHNDHHKKLLKKLKNQRGDAPSSEEYLSLQESISEEENKTPRDYKILSNLYETRKKAQLKRTSIEAKETQTLKEIALYEQKLKLITERFETLSLDLFFNEDIILASNKSFKEFCYKEYLSPTGERIRVSKNKKSNFEMLSLMPGNHLWLHIVGQGGPFVWIVPIKNKVVSDETLKMASVLACHKPLGYEGEVYVTPRAHVKKTQQLGKVRVLRAKKVWIRYSSEEGKTYAACRVRP